MTVEPARSRLRMVHAASAAAIGLFLLFHIANHVVGLGGENRHLAMMAAGRTVYRFPIIEAVLLPLFAWQALSGLMLVIRTWRGRRGGVAWAQASSGLYLSLFLPIHISAVLIGRANGIDTDFRFAAQGMHTGLAWFFVPYYSSAIVALCTHLGCAAYWFAQRGGRTPRPAIVVVAGTIGIVLGGLIVASLGGAFYAVHSQVHV